jgi:hypothetical protein
LHRKEAVVMGDVQVGHKDAPFVKSAEEMAGRFSAELMTLMPGWKHKLQGDPSCLGELEVEIQAAFARGADLVVAGLLALVMKQADFVDSTEETRRDYAVPLRAGRERKVQVRLLGGLVVWITSLYCALRRNGRDTDDFRRGGVYVELVQFGFGKGCSPGLESDVARQAANSPSYQFASEELARDGVDLDAKTVRRIALQCGEGMLNLRSHELDLWRDGKLPAGQELQGKPVSVQIDGGRTRLRGPLRSVEQKEARLDADGMPTQDSAGRSQTPAKRTFDAEWREPKLVTIFVHDEKGRMEKKSQATIDGTFEGPDALAELVAMHLHRLGAAKAKSVTFVADGAPWIWDRIPVIIEQAGLQKVKTYEVLDCCHAAHHISLALAALGLNDKERLPLYRLHRTYLRNGHWRRVVEELTALAEGLTDIAAFHTEITYLTKHGEAGRLKYPTFRALGLPLGSGAIESNIRRVINDRLKGNGKFWDQDNGEAMLQLRAQVISRRWDVRLHAMRQFELTHLRRDWRRVPRPMSTKTEAETPPLMKP